MSVDEIKKSTTITPVNNSIDLEDDADGSSGARFVAFDAATESKWFYRKGPALSRKPWFLVGMRKEIVRWGDDKKIVERIVKTPGTIFPSVEELNSKVPVKEWPENPFGPPKGPYQLNYVFCMANPDTGERIICSNSTWGQKQAYGVLKGYIKTKCAIYGRTLVPILELSHTIMPTNWGPKPRPHFEVLGWRDLNGQAPAVAPLAPVNSLPGEAVAKASSAEIIGDSLPDDPPAPKPAAKSAKRPVSKSADFDDGFPESWNQ